MTEYRRQARGDPGRPRRLGADVVVCSYTLLRLEAAQYRQIAFAGVLLDEAQAVKNHQAKAFAAIKQLDRAFTVAVTGTPLENNLLELWALFSLVAPGLLGSQQRFADYYRTPIEKQGDADRLGAAAPPDRAVPAPPDQGGGGAGPARRSRSRFCGSRWSRPTARSTTVTCSASGRRSSACSATSRATGSPSSGRSRCSGRPASIPPSSIRRTDAAVDQARRAARAGRRGGRRRPPGAGVQPVHVVPRAGSAGSSTGRHRLLLPRRLDPQPPRGARPVPDRRRPVCS